jgi:hypothetical protein
MTMTESQDALAHLAWQVELGADEAILDAPVNRFELPQAVRPPAIAQALQDARRRRDWPRTARQGEGRRPQPPWRRPRRRAERAGTLPELQAALAGFEGCELRHGARNLVFSDGDPRRA